MSCACVHGKEHLLCSDIPGASLSEGQCVCFVCIWREAQPSLHRTAQMSRRSAVHSEEGSGEAGVLAEGVGRLGGSHQRVQLSQGLPTALPQDAPELSQPCFWCCVLILVCAFTSSLPFSGDVKGKEAVSLKFRNLANTPLEETGRAEGQDHSLGFKYNEQAFPPAPTLTPTHLHPPPLCTQGVTSANCLIIAHLLFTCGRGTATPSI